MGVIPSLPADRQAQRGISLGCARPGGKDEERSLGHERPSG
jgi:hypothetical protein